MSGDLYWYNVSLLVHMNGADGSTTFTDETGKIITVVGNTQVDTAQSTFGGASGLFDGTGDKLVLADHADLEFVAEDFTLELWAKLNAASGGNYVLTKGAITASASFIITDAVLVYFSSNGSTFDIANGINIGALSQSVWKHVAITRSGSTWRGYVGGVQGATWTSSAAVANLTGDLQIGGRNDASFGFNGWIDEVRITKGVARYTGASSFTPPSAEFPNTGLILTPTSEALTLGSNQADIRQSLVINLVINERLRSERSLIL